MFVCTDCSYQSMTKLGKCPACQTFGTLVAFRDGTSKSSGKWAKKWPRLDMTHTQNYTINQAELARALQSNLQPGGVYLLAGEPGVGKSTIMLQLLNALTPLPSVLYITAEETADAVQQRLQRLVWETKHITVLSETDWESIQTELENTKPAIICIDSIQTIQTPGIGSIAWSPTQVRQCAELINIYCKQTWTIAFIIGHITKGGEIAGPKYLEHLVDVVLYLESERHSDKRFLRAKKNRFWSSDDMGVFTMAPTGLLPAVLVGINKNLHPGSVQTIWIDNGRPVIITIEALINKANGKYPQRVALWVENQRVQLILAILERYCKIGLWFHDVYVNIPGGRSSDDTGLDLAIAASLLSQWHNVPAPQAHLFVGELGLWGQVTPAYLHTKRAKEAWDQALIDHTTCKHISQLHTFFK